MISNPLYSIVKLGHSSCYIVSFLMYACLFKKHLT